MPIVTPIETKNGYALNRIDERDEYERTVRYTYSVTAPNGRRLGNIMPTEKKARALFEQVLKDAE